MQPLESARAALARGEAHEAARVLDRLLARQPHHADALNLRGVAALHLGDAREAHAFLRRAVSVAPREPMFRENLAEAMLRDGRPEQAAEQAARARRDGPSRGRPLALLGRAALDQGQLVRAVQHLEAAFTMGEHGDDVLLALAVALTRTGRGEEAVSACDVVLARRPSEPAAWLDRGMALKSLGRLRQADEAFARAGESAPARYNRALVALAAGDLERGFALWEARLEVASPGRRLKVPLWDGADLPGGTLLVLAEQGLGDTLLASRCFGALASRAARVVVATPAPLQRLFAASHPGLEFVDETTEVAADAWIGALSLPHRLGVRAWSDLPAAPWLGVPAPGRAPGPLRVGINWAGNPNYAYDLVRSTSLETFAPLLALADVEWVSLHRGVREHEAAAFGLPEPLRTAADFLDTAGVIAGLDLVVSTETAVPNLAGAMGVPTAVITTPDMDWRWRGWYPSVTACPQDRPGEWPGALARVLEVLHTHLSARAA